MTAQVPGYVDIGGLERCVLLEKCAQLATGKVIREFLKLSVLVCVREVFLYAQVIGICQQGSALQCEQAAHLYVEQTLPYLHNE